MTIRNILVILFTSVIITGCSTLSGVANLVSPPDPIVCSVESVPSLPATNENGNVVLEEDDQEALILYIISLEDCVEKIQK